jgi:glycosyltransferase involved in cell wall biosynthesis
MRVLHLSAGNLYGGVETLLVTLARSRALCPELKPEFALCFEGRAAEEIAATGALLHLLGEVRVRRPLSLLRARRRLKELVAQRGFDAVICHSAWAQAIFGPAVRAAGAPLVFWLHDAAAGRHWVERWAAMTPPDLAICNSRFTAATLSALYPKTPAEVVYCPVAALQPAGARHRAERGDGRDITPDAERDAVRAEFDTAPDATVVIQVSRMEEWKGHRLHLKALAQLAAEPGWICWIVGGAQRPHERQYLDALRAEAAALGIAHRVRFVGRRNDVGRLLAAADIYCQPNIGPEPFGIAFIEALYAALPVVSTALGGALEIVDESCGFLVAPNDAGSLAGALRRLMSDRELRARLGAAGPARAAALCAPARQLARLAVVLGLARTPAAARRLTPGLARPEL